MSHFTKIKTKLYDRVTIEKSLSDLNIEWESNAEKIRGYNNQEHSADIVIRQSNNHEIGFKWNDIEYELVADLMFWDQKYSVNKFLNQLNQRYAFNLIAKVSEEQSFQYVEAENQQNGSIRLLLTEYHKQVFFPVCISFLFIMDMSQVEVVIVYHGNFSIRKQCNPFWFFTYKYTKVVYI